jgi:AraC-like DNA-binding protein
MTRVLVIPETIIVHVPFRLVKRGGRKEMVPPVGAAQPRRTDNTLVKALARAFRWKRLLESGDYTTIAELAEREGIASSYMTRILRLTLLAPGIVEAILDDRQLAKFQLDDLLVALPGEWEEQRRMLLAVRTV